MNICTSRWKLIGAKIRETFGLGLKDTLFETPSHS